MTGFYKFATNDCWAAWSMIFEKGTYSQVLQRGKPKEGYSKNWPDQNGTERPILPRYLESIVMTLPVVIIGNSKADILSKYDAVCNFLENSGLFNFDIKNLNKRIRVVYTDITPFNKLTSFQFNGKPAIRFTITLTNDFPTEKLTIPA